MKEPRKLSMQTIFDITNGTGHRQNMIYKNGLGILIDEDRVFRYLMRQAQPFLIEDYRMGILKRGRMRAVINLKECDFHEGMIAFVTPGTIAVPVEISDDFVIEGMGVHADVFHLALGGQIPELFNGTMRNGYAEISAADRDIVDTMFHTLFKVAGNEHNNLEPAYGMVASIARYYDMLVRECEPFVAAHNRAQDIFDRFIALVNRHCREERQLSFYAAQLFISERYLGTVVRQFSGITAKEWVDRAAVTSAKVMLRHGNMTIAQIADELHFPNASFFCKYFRRLTGMTPQEYRSARV